MTTRPALDVWAGHGPGVGAGHLGRCLALAQAWIEAGGTARLVDDGRLPEPWAQRYRSCTATWVVEQEARRRPAPFAVVDDYAASEVSIAALRRYARVLRIDDFGTSEPSDADLVLDQNLGASAASYPTVAPERLLLGPRYALLRRDVVAALPDAVPDRGRPPRRLLVALGGDPSPALRAAADDATTSIVAEQAIEVVALRGVEDVGSVLRTVDVAMSAAGSTCWDLSAHGVPTVVVAVAPNQRPIARALGAAGAAVDVGDLDAGTGGALARAVRGLLGDPLARVALAETACALVDGGGAARVVAALRSR